MKLSTWKKKKNQVARREFERIDKEENTREKKIVEKELAIMKLTIIMKWTPTMGNSKGKKEND